MLHVVSSSLVLKGQCLIYEVLFFKGNVTYDVRVTQILDEDCKNVAVDFAAFFKWG